MKRRGQLCSESTSSSIIIRHLSNNYSHQLALYFFNRSLEVVRFLLQKLAAYRTYRQTAPLLDRNVATLFYFGRCCMSLAMLVTLNIVSSEENEMINLKCAWLMYRLKNAVSSRTAFLDLWPFMYSLLFILKLQVLFVCNVKFRVPLDLNFTYPLVSE
jgi:hypothetical protein